jgi:hypothetical protein
LPQYSVVARPNLLLFPYKNVPIVWYLACV